MKLMPYQIDSYGMSDIGNVRANNEDVFDMVLERSFFALADGMGGHNAGEVASSEALKTLNRAIRYAPPFSSTEEISRYLLHAIERANQRVWQLSLGTQAFTGMGTTISCFLIHEESLVYAHIGDSRLYRFRQTLQQLSRDHSLRATLLEENIDPELLNQPGFKNVLTRALGTQAYIIPDIGVIPIQNEDLYLLCSDGLTDLVSDQEIGAILGREKTLEQMGKALISAALKKGGNDNITVVLVKILHLK